MATQLERVVRDLRVVKGFIAGRSAEALAEENHISLVTVRRILNAHQAEISAAIEAQPSAVMEEEAENLSAAAKYLRSNTLEIAKRLVDLALTAKNPNIAARVGLGVLDRVGLSPSPPAPIAPPAQPPSLSPEALEALLEALKPPPTHYDLDALPEPIDALPSPEEPQ